MLFLGRIFMQVVQNKAFDEERAFYGSRDIKIIEWKPSKPLKDNIK